jgi:hypothetical protein
MPRRKRTRDDFDSPWKEALEYFLPHFLAFFYPGIYSDIDWSKGFESLDKELHQLVRDARTPKGLADKLFKVWLTEAGETWLLIHIEVQGQAQATFPYRMFVYNIRAFDRYNKAVVSLGVLTDDQPAWREDHFEYGRWGGRTRLDFLPVKLLDYRGREAALEREQNPFAQVVLAHLHALATRQDPAGRQRYKVQLVKGLYDRGWPAEQVRELFRLIDWMMDLPPEHEQGFHQEISRWEEERGMQYVTSLERLGLKKGLEQGRLEEIHENIATSLQIKFGIPGKRLASKIRKINDLDGLRVLFQGILKAESLAEVRQLLAR